MEGLHNPALHSILLTWSNQGWDGWDLWHTWRDEKCVYDFVL